MLVNATQAGRSFADTGPFRRPVAETVRLRRALRNSVFGNDSTIVSAGSAMPKRAVHGGIVELVGRRWTSCGDYAEKTQRTVFNVAISSTDRHLGCGPRQVHDLPSLSPELLCSCYDDRGCMPSIHDVYRPFLLHFRRVRMQFLHDHFQLTPSTRVLDVGGTLFNWTLAPVMPRLTLLNLEPRPTDLPAEIEVFGKCTDTASTNPAASASASPARASS